MFLRTGTFAALSLVLSSGSAFAEHDAPTAISFSSANCFNVDTTYYPLIIFHGPEVVDLDPFGTTTLDWTIVVEATATGIEFIAGVFAFHLDRKLLWGHYTGFTLDPLTGAYVLGWSFDGGTGKFRRVEGSGETNGVVNLATYCAEYSFEGELYGLPGM
jgi:hypothetical protein